MVAIAAAPGKTETPQTLNLYPNPVREEVTLELGNHRYRTMKLLDMNGRLLRQWTIPAGSTKISRSLGNLPGGNYIIRLEGASAPASIKIIKL
jgi:hypothetical protein